MTFQRGLKQKELSPLYSTEFNEYNEDGYYYLAVYHVEGKYYYECIGHLDREIWSVDGLSISHDKMFETYKKKPLYLFGPSVPSIAHLNLCKKLLIKEVDAWFTY